MTSFVNWRFIDYLSFFFRIKMPIIISERDGMSQLNEFPLKIEAHYIPTSSIDQRSF